MATYRVSVHTGPLNSDAAAEFASRVEAGAGCPVNVGTERVYFTVAADDAIDAYACAQAILARTFGPGTALQPKVLSSTYLCDCTKPDAYDCHKDRHPDDKLTHCACAYCHK